MKNNNLALAGLFVAVAAIVFVAVYFLLLQPSAPPAPPTDPDTSAHVPGSVKPKVDRRKPVRDRTKRPRRPRRKEPERKITGRVLDGDGNAVEAADVTLYQPSTAKPNAKTVRWKDLDVIHVLIELDDDEWDIPRPMDTWAEGATSEASSPEATRIVGVKTAVDGSFRIDVPRTGGVGPFQIAAERDGVGSGQADHVRIGHEGLEIQLGSPGVVTGQVLTETGGQPVGDVRVVFSAQAGNFSGVTDANGRFRIEGMVPGAYSVLGSKKGLTPLRKNRVDVQPDGPDVDLRMPRGTTVKIRACLVDDDHPTPEDAPPVPGAEVVLMDMDSLAYLIGKTDSNGIVKFDSLPAGSYLLNGRKTGLVTFGELPVEITGRKEAQDQPIEFEKAVPTPIVVVDSDKNPVAGFQFYSSNWSAEWDQLRSVKLPGKTDQDGVYEFEFDEIGPREMIWGFKKGYALVQAFPEEYDSGEKLTLVAGPGLQVSGTVRDKEGRAVPNAIVLIEAEPEEDLYIEDVILRVRTDAQGRYEFGHLQPGIVWLGAETEEDWSDMVDFELEKGNKPVVKDLVLEAVPDPKPKPKPPQPKPEKK